MFRVICSSRWVLLMSLNLAQKCPASTTWEGRGRVGRRVGGRDKGEGERKGGGGGGGRGKKRGRGGRKGEGEKGKERRREVRGRKERERKGGEREEERKDLHIPPTPDTSHDLEGSWVGWRQCPPQLEGGEERWSPAYLNSEKEIACSSCPSSRGRGRPNPRWEGPCPQGRSERPLDAETQ